jgi:hypothetical protein
LHEQRILLISMLSAFSIIMAFAGGVWYFRRHRPILSRNSCIDKFILFLDRPNGGLEFETCYGVAALWYAVIFTLTPEAVLNLRTTKDLAFVMPHYVLAIPWWISSACTLVGLLLFKFRNHWCAPLRWIGAFVATFVWSVMFERGLIETGGALPTLVFYFIGMIWSPRLMMSSWGRWRGTWNRRGHSA